MRAILLAGALALSGAATCAQAEVIGTAPGDQNTTAPTTSTGVFLSGYNNVGQVNGASGVYLGGGYVITANHVAAGDFVLNGTTYPIVPGSAHQLSTPSTYGTAGPQPTDLLIFQVSGNTSTLPTVTLASNEITNAQEIYSVGFGLSRPANEALTNYYVYSTDGGNSFIWSTTPVAGEQTTPNAAGYAESGGGVKMWGNNTVTTFNSTSGQIGNPGDPVVNPIVVNGDQVQEFISQFYSASALQIGGDTEEQEIALGDSGGGVFNDAGQLVGINDAELNFVNQPDSTAVLGNASGYVDLFEYENQINSIIDVPEPAAGLVALIGLGSIGMRRRRLA